MVAFGGGLVRFVPCIAEGVSPTTIAVEVDMVVEAGASSDASTTNEDDVVMC